MNQSFSKIWIIVILVFVIAGGILAWQYWWVPKEKVKAPADETADWKTYRNEEYGFEFKYPKQFAENKDCAAREINNIIYIGNRVSISIEDSGGLDLAGYVDKTIKEAFEYTFIESRENTKVGGEDAIIIKYRVEGTMRYGEEIFLLKDGKIYSFSFLAGGECPVAQETDYSELDVLHDMLSTFRFLEVK